jgi:YHS domain-containing protein
MNMKKLIAAFGGIGVVLLTAGMAVNAQTHRADDTNQAVMVTGKAQTACPIMGDNISRKHFTDYEGKRIYFCCAKCEKTFAKNPGKYMKMLADEGIALEDAPKAGVQPKSVTEKDEHAGHQHE